MFHSAKTSKFLKEFPKTGKKLETLVRDSSIWKEKDGNGKGIGENQLEANGNELWHEGRFLMVRWLD